MSTSSYSKPSSSRNGRSCCCARSHRWQPSALKSTTLGIQTARGGRLGNALDRQPVCGQAHREVSLLLRLPRLVEGARDDLVQALVDLRLLPEVLLEALDPLEVRDDDAARIREHVRKDQHAVALENLVRLGSRGAVRPLDEDLRLDAVRVRRRDHLLEGA